MPRLANRLVRHAAGVDHGDVRRTVPLLVPVGEQTLADALGIGMRDLAAKEPDGERGHRRVDGNLTPSRATKPRPPSPPTRHAAATGTRAEPGARVGSRSEGAARLDHDRRRIRGRLQPRRAQPEWADASRAMEVAPALLPAVTDLGRASASERLPEALLAPGVRVRDQLDTV